MAKFRLQDFGLGVNGFNNIIELFYDTMSTTGMVEPVPGGHYITSWYHPVQGYDVGYYGEFEGREWSKSSPSQDDLYLLSFVTIRYASNRVLARSQRPSPQLTATASPHSAEEKPLRADRGLVGWMAGWLVGRLVD